MACWRKHDDFSIHVFLAITSYSFQTSSIVYSRWLDMRASKSYTLSHWVCWAVFQLLGYRWQLDPRSESRNLSLHRHKKHSTRSVWKGQSASIWVYLNFEAQAKSSSSSEVVKIMSLPATSLQVTAHGFRTWTRFWPFWPLRLNGTSREAWWVQKCASDQAQQSVWNWDVVLEDFPHCVQGFI